MTKVGIIGAGNFGFALAQRLATDHAPALELWLYDRKKTITDQIIATRHHPHYYPQVSLPTAVTVTSDLPALVAACDYLILAVVSTAVEAVLAALKPLLTTPVTIISVMKALDDDTGQTLTQVIEQQLAPLPVTTAVFAGGTTGEALTQTQYLGATLACADEQKLADLKAIFSSAHLQIQLSTDVIGVQLASSLKNVIALIVGMLKGLGFAYGTQTHALTLAATEGERLSVALGAQPETFSLASQCWGNDMVMSATGETRNHQLGVLLGEGMPFAAAVTKLTQTGKMVESVNTLAILAKKVDLRPHPLFNFLTQLAAGQVAAAQLIGVLETYPS